MNIINTLYHTPHNFFVKIKSLPRVICQNCDTPSHLSGTTCFILPHTTKWIGMLLIRNNLAFLLGNIVRNCWKQEPSTTVSVFCNDVHIMEVSMNNTVWGPGGQLCQLDCYMWSIYDASFLFLKLFLSQRIMQRLVLKLHLQNWQSIF